MPLPGSPIYSTLELAKHDATTGAPERDHALVAPENARELDAPETAPSSGPETFYSNALPEAVVDIEVRSTTKAASLAHPRPRHARSKATIILSAIAAAIVVAVAVGVGVGVGLRPRKPSDSDSTTLASTATETAASRPTASAGSRLIKRGILNDSSVAMVQHLDSGDRRLFFQEDTGIIRHAIHSSSTNAWKADLIYTVASDAKNHTPITALGSVNSPDVFVFYIFTNNSLACKYFSMSEWVPCSGIPNFSVATDSRHLQIVTVAPEQHRVYMLLMYEPSYGGVGVLNGSLIDYSGSNATWVWHNASRKLDPKSSFRLSAPFSGVYNWYMNITTFVFASESGNWTFTDEFRNQSAFPGNCPAGFDVSPSHSIDTLLLIVGDYGPGNFWVHNNTLMNWNSDCKDLVRKEPETPFPFKRLAGTEEYNSTNLIIYHQLNTTTFAEDKFDASIGNWVSTFFDIQTA